MQITSPCFPGRCVCVQYNFKKKKSLRVSLLVLFFLLFHHFRQLVCHVFALLKPVLKFRIGFRFFNMAVKAARPLDWQSNHSLKVSIILYYIFIIKTIGYGQRFFFNRLFRIIWLLALEVGRKRLMSLWNVNVNLKKIVYRNIACWYKCLLSPMKYLCFLAPWTCKNLNTSHRHVCLSSYVLKMGTMAFIECVE